MEINEKNAPKVSLVGSYLKKIKNKFFSENHHSQKKDINIKAFQYCFLIGLVVFVVIVFALPNDYPIEFSEKIQRELPSAGARSTVNVDRSTRSNSDLLWGSPQIVSQSGSSLNQVNHNTSMVIQNSGGNAKTMLNAGKKVLLKISDKVTVSDEPVPLIAVLLLDVESESGLRLSQGTTFYGMATYRKGSRRAEVKFTQISLLDGQLKKISAMAISMDGQPGIEGDTHSDGGRNTAGQVITSFVSGMASGGMETDVLGRAKGGLQNGLLGAIASTAQTRAQVYGEKLKAEREWIELAAGTECEAVLNESYGFQESSRYE